LTLLQKGNKIERKNRKQTYQSIPYIYMVALSLAVCALCTACKGDTPQKEKLSNSSGYSFDNEIELPDVEL